MENFTPKENATSCSPGEKVYEHEAGLKQITSFNSDRFHVKSSLEEWANTPYDWLETVIVDEPELGRFEFNVKIHQLQKRRDVYIPCCAVARLKQLHEQQRGRATGSRKPYSAPSLIRFAFNYSESAHWLRAHEVAEQKRSRLEYREPCDGHVARLVANGYYRPDASVADLSELDAVYYYLAVLRCLDCPPLEGAMRRIREACAADQRLCQAAILPANASCSSARAQYYTLYAEAIHFLGLMSPPTCIGDSQIDIVEKVRQRNVEQTKQLCDFVGITNYTIADRGREWFKIVKFFDANPDFCAIMGAAIVDDEQQPSLTVIEKQTLQQIRQLWMWRKMQDFHKCYAFATSRQRGRLHRMTAIAQQCAIVRRQYGQMVASKGDERLVPFLSFYLGADELRTMTSVERVPELFYAAVSASVEAKRGNNGWEHFVATRPATMARDQIEALLAGNGAAGVDRNDHLPAGCEEAEQPLREHKFRKCAAGDGRCHESDRQDSGVAVPGYFPTDFNSHELEYANELKTERIYEGISAWEAVLQINPAVLGSDADAEWDVCDREHIDAVSPGSDPLDLHELHFNEANREKLK